MQRSNVKMKNATTGHFITLAPLGAIRMFNGQKQS